MLMLLVLVFGCWLGWYVGSVREQQRAVDAIKRAGGVVSYDWNWGNYNPDLLDFSGRRRPSKWLLRRVGIDYVANVRYVGLELEPRGGKRTAGADNPTLMRLGCLHHLKFLNLSGRAITDAGLPHLRHLKRLRQLELSHTPISDAGLAHLRGLTALRHLGIEGTRVTDAMVLELEKAIPGLRVTVDGDRLDGTLCQRAIADLEFARSQPVRLACGLLRHRAHVMATRKDPAEFAATVRALCDLEADDALSLARLVEARGQCLARLESGQAIGMTVSQRLALQRLCRARGVAARRRAIELGYDNFRLLDPAPTDSSMLWEFRDDPAFSTAIAKMKAKQRAH
jgi:hypothetical protein